jgi:hypothetical protein
MPRYFYTDQAHRPFVFGKRSYTFTALPSAGGGWPGIFKAETPESEADLGSIVRRGISEITAEEYEAQKKRVNSPVVSPNSNSSKQSTHAPSAFQSIQPPQDVASAASVAPTPEQTLPEPESLLVVGRISPPQPFVKESDRMKPKAA